MLRDIAMIAESLSRRSEARVDFAVRFKLGMKDAKRLAFWSFAAIALSYALRDWHRQISVQRTFQFLRERLRKIVTSYPAVENSSDGVDQRAVFLMRKFNATAFTSVILLTYPLKQNVTR
jgi:hypothetical protein